MRNPLVTGDRVYLRPLEAADAEPLARLITEDTEVTYRGRIPASPIGIERFIEKSHEALPTPPGNLEFAVCLRADDCLIGVVNVDHLDWINRTGETGSFLAPAAVRNQGYGTEAKHLLLEYCFDRLHLHALRSHVWEPNARSAAALAKQGYRPAGRLKWDDVKHGAYRDGLLFDILRPDWLAARAAWRAERAGGAS